MSLSAVNQVKCPAGGTSLNCSCAHNVGSKVAPLAECGFIVFLHNRKEGFYALRTVSHCFKIPFTRKGLTSE